MAERNNDKGLITWICTLITLIVSWGFVAGMFGTFFSTGSMDSWWSLAWGVAGLIAAIYLTWHGVMILLGRQENTWLFVGVAFVAGILGGILMLIAKLLN